MKKKVKVVVKKKARTASKVGAEVFTTTERHTNVPKGSVLLFVNGEEKGIKDAEGKKLGEFAVAKAQHYGIRTFSVYVDDVKASTADSNKSLATVSKLEIVAKDARG